MYLAMGQKEKPPGPQVLVYLSFPLFDPYPFVPQRLILKLTKLLWVVSLVMLEPWTLITDTPDQLLFSSLLFILFIWFAFFLTYHG